VYEEDGKKYLTPFEKNLLARKESGELVRRDDDGRYYVAGLVFGLAAISKIMEGDNPQKLMEGYRKAKRGIHVGKEGIQRAGKYAFEKMEAALEDGRDPFTMAGDKFAEVTGPYIEKMTEYWMQAKEKQFNKIKIVLRSNDEDQIRVYSNELRTAFKQYGWGVLHFIDTPVPTLSSQDYYSFPIDTEKIKAIFEDKKIYLQSPFRTQEQGPFYQIEGEIDLRYVDMPKLASLFNQIFKQISSHNKGSWPQSGERFIDSQYGRKGIPENIQISIEVVEE
jgi:hypothetical protein